MKLTELNPRWIHANVFMFECPHCRKVLLTVKNAVMPFTEQHELFYETFGQSWPVLIVGAKDDYCWTFCGSDFSSMTVSPSIDASASDHWHGNVTNGEIR